jgi:hypothetical protein
MEELARGRGCEAASSGGGTVGAEGSWHMGEAASGGGGTVGTEGSWHMGGAASGGGGGTVGTEEVAGSEGGWTAFARQ